MAAGGGKRIIGEGKYVRLVDDAGWEYLERKRGRGVVAIAAVTAKGELILVEQHRQSMGGSVIELPAGLVGDDAGAEGEGLAEAAARELLEETGYEAASMEWLTRGPSSTGMTNEIIDYFRARGLRRRGDGGGVGGEHIAVHCIPVTDAGRWLAARLTEGRRIDPRIYIGLYFLTGHS